MSALILFKGQEHTQGKGSENSFSALIAWRICTLKVWGTSFKLINQNIKILKSLILFSNKKDKSFEKRKLRVFSLFELEEFTSFLFSWLGLCVDWLYTFYRIKYCKKGHLSRRRWWLSKHTSFFEIARITTSCFWRRLVN